MSEKTLAIVYSFSDNYCMYAATSITSLFENNRNIHFDVYIIGDSISKDNEDKFKRIADSYQNEITIIEMPDLSQLCGENIVLNRWSKATYSRVFLPRLLPEDVEKLIYLDTDTLVVDSIDDLFEFINSPGFDSYYLAGCIEPSPDLKKYHCFKKTDLYYNTGLLAINLKKWRDDQLQEILIREMKRRRGRAIDADQSYINCVFVGKIKKLPAQYNVMTSYYQGYEIYRRRFADQEIYRKEEIEYAICHPVIIHFVGATPYFSNVTIRPWYANSQHPEKEQWRKYHNLTEWKDMVYPEFRFAEGQKFNLKQLIVKTALSNRFSAQIILRLKHGYTSKLYRKI